MSAIQKPLENLTPGRTNRAYFTTDPDDESLELHVHVDASIDIAAAQITPASAVYICKKASYLLMTYSIGSKLFCITANASHPELLSVLRQASSQGKLTFVVSTIDKVSVRLKHQYVLRPIVENLLIETLKRKYDDKEFFREYSSFADWEIAKQHIADLREQCPDLTTVVECLVLPYCRGPLPQ